MREAVIVSTARTPIGKAYRGAFNDTQAQTLGGHAIESARQARLGRSRRGRRRGDGRGAPAGLGGRQCRPPGAAARRLARQCRRHVGRPAMRLGPDGDRHRGQGDHRRRHERHHRRRARIHLPRPERQDEPLSSAGPLARRASRRRVHDDDRDGGDRRRAIPGDAPAPGRICAAVAAEDRRGPGRRALRRRDRAPPHRDEGRRQGDRRRLGQAGHAEAGRGSPRRHDLGWPRSVEARVRRRAADQGGLVHHRRQRLATLGRRQRLRLDGGQAREPAQPRSRSGSIAASRSPAATRTRWASDRCSPCRSSSRRTDSRSTTSACGN